MQAFSQQQGSIQSLWHLEKTFSLTRGWVSSREHVLLPWECCRKMAMIHFWHKHSDLEPLQGRGLPLTLVRDQGQKGKCNQGTDVSMSLSRRNLWDGSVSICKWATRHGIPMQLWRKDQYYSVFVRTEWDSIAQLKMQCHSSSCCSLQRWVKGAYSNS